MTKSHSITRRLTTLIVLTASLTTPGFAQRLGVSVGYSRMTGDIGSLVSNEGITVRAGAELNPGSTLQFGIEAGMDRYNQNRQLSPIPCDHPAGGTATCHFDSRDRDTGLSLAVIVRAGPNTGLVRPYVLAGFGVLGVRTRSSTLARDSTGTRLPNFESDDTHYFGAFMAPLGGGVLFRPAESPISVGLEARMTPMRYGHEGNHTISWSPSLALTVRW
jgi:hypothetical protein